MEDLTGKQFGHYQIVAPLGEGGMAAVYKGYQPSMERYVAIKVLPRHMADSEEFVARFKREAKLLAQLQHPHILPVFDYGESEGYTYIVMPFVQSGTLTEVIKSRSLSMGEIRRIMIQLGGALHYAHSRGMIHRDIKPSNVLVDETHNCLLTDFGLARMTEEAAKLTSSGTVMGTPAYMSPEQGMGGNVDQRSDIYSLGIILYEMVTGRVPYSAETPIAIVFKHIQDPLPPVRSINPHLPETVELVLFKALAKNPEDRYQSASEFVEAIKRAIPETEETIENPQQQATSDKATFYEEKEKTEQRSKPAVVQTLVSESKPATETLAATREEKPPQKTGKPFPLWALVGGAALVLLVVLGGWWIFSGGRVNPPLAPPPGAPQENGGGLTQPQTPPTRLPAAGGAEAKVTIVMWHSWAGKDLAAVQRIVNLYENAHPNVSIEMAELPDADTIGAKINAGQGPDILVMVNDNIGRLTSEQLIADLDRLGVEPPFMKETYEAKAVQAVTWKDRTWGFPDYMEGITLIYNKATATRDDFPAVPQNFFNLLEKSQAYARENPGKYLVCNPGFAEGNAYQVAPIYFGFGVPGYVSENGQVNINTPPALEAARWMKEFKQFTFANATYESCVNFLIEGKTAAIWTGPWELERLRASGVDYGIAPMGSPFVGVMTLMITRNAVEREHQFIAVDFARFFTNTDNAINLSLARETVPANVAALNDRALQENETLHAFWVNFQSGIILSPNPITIVQWEPVGQATAKIWNGSQTPEEALAEAQQRMEAEIARMKP